MDRLQRVHHVDYDILKNLPQTKGDLQDLILIAKKMYNASEYKFEEEKNVGLYLHEKNLLEHEDRDRCGFS